MKKLKSVSRGFVLALALLSFFGCADSSSSSPDNGQGENASDSSGDQTSWTRLEYQDAPADNPLKGFTRWAGGSPRRDAFSFPHSMEFGKIRLNEIMTDFNSFDWSELEELLELSI